MQQELRWLAIYTQDPTLIEVYQKGLDMHSKMTCQVQGFNYDMFEEIRNYKADTVEATNENIRNIIKRWGGTDELNYALSKFGISELTEDNLPSLANEFEVIRKKMKSTVFGTIYGISEIGLSDQLAISKEEAKALIDGFKAGLPFYLRWEAETHKEMFANGYVETWLGRKRRFGETLAEAMSTDLYKKKKWHWKIEKCKRQSTNVKIQGLVPLAC